MFEKCLERFYVLSCSRLLDCGIEIIYVRKTLHGGQNLMKKSKESPGKIIKQTLVFTISSCWMSTRLVIWVRKPIPSFRNQACKFHSFWVTASIFKAMEKKIKTLWVTEFHHVKVELNRQTRHCFDYLFKFINYWFVVYDRELFYCDENIVLDCIKY